jgi:hypothetical protein
MMTDEQIKILEDVLAGAIANTWTVEHIEYPSQPHNWRHSDGKCMKITTVTMARPKTRHIFWYGENGSTVESSSYPA